MKEIDFIFVKVCYEAPIVTLHVADKASITYFDLKNVTHKTEELTEYKSYLLLVNMGRNVNITPEAMRSAGSVKEQPLRKATAVVFDPDFQKTIPEFFGDIQPDDSVPRRHFTDPDQAKAWLLQQVELIPASDRR